MLVISKNAEKRLQSEINRYAKDNPRRKCFYIQFSKTQLDKGKVFETFIRQLNALPNSYMAQVYICNDLDIFILMQGFMQRQFSDLIDGLAKELDAPELTKLANTFEVGHHERILKNLCADKIEILDNSELKEKEAALQAQADKATMDILAQLNAGLISDVAKRRDARATPSILVVDDDQLSRTLAGNVISKEHHVIYAQNGREALNEYINNAPDVVFLDIGMPDINGHRVLECMMQIDPEAYVIMFSGRKDKANIMQALEIGAQGFIGKPFTRDKLFEYIGKSSFVREKQERHSARPDNFIHQNT